MRGKLASLIGTKLGDSIFFRKHEQAWYSCQVASRKPNVKYRRQGRQQGWAKMREKLTSLLAGKLADSILFP
jgi:hypothetical protein